MEYAISLKNPDELFHARDVSYDETRELQTVCPACREAVFKSGSDITKRQYFSHYTAKPDTNCELRVARIVKERLNTVAIFPKGQELEKFFKNFEAILLQYRTPVRFDRYHFLINRPFFRFLLSGGTRRFIAKTLKRDLIEKAETIKTLATQDISTEHLQVIVDFILAPNSFKVCLFSVCYGLMFIKEAQEYFEQKKEPLLNPLYDQYDGRYVLDIVLELTDLKLKQLVKNAGPTKRNEFRMKLAILCLAAIAQTAGMFTYATMTTKPFEI